MKQAVFVILDEYAIGKVPICQVRLIKAMNGKFKQLQLKIWCLRLAVFILQSI